MTVEALGASVLCGVLRLWSIHVSRIRVWPLQLCSDARPVAVVYPPTPTRARVADSQGETVDTSITAKMALFVAIVALLMSGSVLLLIPKSASPATVNGSLRITLDEPIQVQRVSKTPQPTPIPTATLYAPAN